MTWECELMKNNKCIGNAEDFYLEEYGYWHF